MARGLLRVAAARGDGANAERLAGRGRGGHDRAHLKPKGGAGGEVHRAVDGRAAVRLAVAVGIGVEGGGFEVAGIAGLLGDGESHGIRCVAAVGGRVDEGDRAAGCGEEVAAAGELHAMGDCPQLRGHHRVVGSRGVRSGCGDHCQLEPVPVVGVARNHGPDDACEGRSSCQNAGCRNGLVAVGGPVPVRVGQDDDAAVDEVAVVSGHVVDGQVEDVADVAGVGDHDREGHGLAGGATTVVADQQHPVTVVGSHRCPYCIRLGGPGFAHLVHIVARRRDIQGRARGCIRIDPPPPGQACAIRRRQGRPASGASGPGRRRPADPGRTTLPLPSRTSTAQVPPQVS